MVRHNETAAHRRTMAPLVAFGRRGPYRVFAGAQPPLSRNSAERWDLAKRPANSRAPPDNGAARRFWTEWPISCVCRGTAAIVPQLGGEKRPGFRNQRVL